MRRIALIIGVLECYALGLAVWMSTGGVRTDEAKYLLNIPYPHPPFARSILSLGSALPAHELLTRFVLASLLVQGVWLVWDMGITLKLPRRLALAFTWLASAAFVLQAGTAMLAPLTALFGLIFVWLALQPHPVSSSSRPYIALLWLAALFSAYQSILFLPLVLAVLASGKASRRSTAIYLLLPIIVLAVYSLSNPLALASMLKVSVQDSPLSFLERASNILCIWLVAGSGVASLVGTWGILSGGRKSVIFSFLLVFAFIALTSQSYYAILLTPLFVAGVFEVLSRRRLSPALYSASLAGVTIGLIAMSPPSLQMTAARGVMKAITARDQKGIVLIDGYFGRRF
jgi:hypothetical protein